MSEREIRGVLEQVLRKVVLSTALGAGLALGAGACSDDSGPKTDGKVADGKVADAKPVVDAGPRPEQIPLPYMAPDAAPLHHQLTHRS